MRHHASVHIDAATEVRFHCDQEEGASWVLGNPFEGSMVVYLSGTADDLRTFAARCREAADEWDRNRVTDDDELAAIV